MNHHFYKLSTYKLLHLLAIILYLIFIYFCVPLFFAFFLSSIFIPILEKLEQKLRLHYYVLIFICSFVVTVFISLMMYVVFSYGDQLILLAYKSLRHVFLTLEEIPILSYIITPLQQVIIDLMSKVTSVLQLFIHYVFDFLLFVIAFYFSLVEGRNNRYWYFIYTPKPFRQKWQQFFHEALWMFTRYFTIELRLMVITACILSIGFTFLQFPQPIFKAILLAILDCIPFFGISLVLIPCILYFLFIQNLSVAVGLVVLLVVTIVVRQLLDTYFWSTFVKIKTIHTFFISGVSFLIFGFYGMLISPIILLVVMKMQLHYDRH